MARIPPWLQLAAVGLAVLLAALPALAQEPQQTATARSLFTEGVALADDGRWEEAADRFRRSLALRPSPVVSYNLASALVELGALVEASELLRGVARDDDAPDEVRSASEEFLAELEPRIGSLTVTVDGPPEGVRVTVDGTLLPTPALGVPTPADPGTRTVVATRAGERLARREVEVPEGGAAEVALEIPDAADLPPVQPEGGGAAGDRSPLADETGEGEPESSGGLFSSPWFWVGVGAILAGGAVAAMLLLGGRDGEGEIVPGNLEPAWVEF